MKYLTILIVCLVFSCSSKKEDPKPQSQQSQIYGDMTIFIKTYSGITIVNPDGSTTPVYTTETRIITSGCVSIGNGTATYYYESENDEFGLSPEYTNNSQTICYGDR